MLFLKIIRQENSSKVDINSVQDSELLIYSKNIQQKKNNNHLIKDEFFIPCTFSNFGINENSTKMAYINENNILIVINLFDKRIQTILPLPEEIIKYKDRFIYRDKRNFMKKMFLNLSFLHLNWNTNNIFFLFDNIIIFTSRKKFLI
jgi:hypothetical protein